MKTENFIALINIGFFQGVYTEIFVFGNDLKGDVSMDNVDTTAGFTNLLNLNLSSGLSASYKKEMNEYRDRMSIMQNLRVMDIFSGIIDNFNGQLKEANKGIYDYVGNDLRYNFPEASFKRDPGKNQWSIEVITGSNLFSTTYRTRRFADYSYYSTDAVSLAPLKGVGGNIDFNNPSTFMNIDAGELDIYVSLETKHLNDEIKNIFDNGGTFEQHQKSEVGESGHVTKNFIKYYTEYLEGEAK